MRTKVWVALALIGSLAVSAALGWRVLRKRAREHAAPVAAGSDDDSDTPRTATPLQPLEMLYDGQLARGWDDWGWGPHELGGGPAKVVFASYGGILFHHAQLSWRYGGLAFRFSAPPDWGNFLHVSLRQLGEVHDAFPLVNIRPRHVAPLPNGWQEVLVPWQELNPERLPFDRVQIGTAAQTASDWVLLDKVMLTKALDASGGATDGALKVLCHEPGVDISSLIYGSAAEDWTSGQSARRIGGNPLTRANWDSGTWNLGSDWFFENVDAHWTIFDALLQAAKQRRQIAVVVPTIGWVAKDSTSVGFPREKFNDQRKFDPYRAEAGDGFRLDGTPLKPGDPTQTSQPAPPELIEKWVRRVVEQDTKQGARSVAMYILDNEPTLWSVTHRDVHPAPLSYDELLERTTKYAAAIRNADPDAVIAGPAEWGWTGYYFSAVDRDAGLELRPDRKAHGGVPLVPWLLKRLAEQERVVGKPLLDVLDLHFYPAADGVYGGNGSANTDPAGSALRLRSTRALWDPGYKDESWIGEPVRLIPRMKEWVDQNYPGRKLSLGEWSFGAEEHISGGLATAEALGRFGQQRLDAAFHWGSLKPGTPTYWAFRAFRDFDGKGSRFQDISLPVTEADTVSLFASRNAQKSRLVLVLINRDADRRVDAQVGLQGCGRVVSSSLFSYGAGAPGLVAGTVRLSDAQISAALEPYSITVVNLEIAPDAP